VLIPITKENSFLFYFVEIKASMVDIRVWLFVVGCLLICLVWFLAQTPHGWNLHKIGATQCDLRYIGESNLTFRYSNMFLLLYRTVAFAHTLIWMLYTLSAHDKVWFYYTAWSWLLLCIYFGMAMTATLAVLYQCGCSGTCDTMCLCFQRLTSFSTAALILQNCMLSNTVVVTVGYWLFVFDHMHWDKSTVTEQFLALNFHGINFFLILADYIQCTCHIYLRHLSILLAFMCAYTIYLLVEYSQDPSDLAYERWDPQRQPETSLELLILMAISSCAYLLFMRCNGRYSKPKSMLLADQPTTLGVL
jgi:hypothetical protein